MTSSEPARFRPKAPERARDLGSSPGLIDVGLEEDFSGTFGYRKGLTLR